ncbi:MAG: ImmA/IrrE family metallo-endopeptidase [Candidatus Dojkabacteria bacterium]|nr:MAG: ImmA/IrrE family metallo-endopeptidase [Candidatus Dojkabacteria bacterium]
MAIKVIKTDEEYQEALELLTALMAKDIEPHSSEAETLELLAALIEDYEETMWGENIPDPIDALQFRMEQQGLTADDLVPYIGSRSKVSEVLSRKRPLSLNMLKSLQTGLGIPANVLLNQPRTQEFKGVDIEQFPLKEMIKRGYIQGKIDEGLDYLEKKVNEFLSPVLDSTHISTLLSKTSYIRSSRPMSRHALIAWVAEVMRKAEQKENIVEFDVAYLDKNLLNQVIKFSSEDGGINKAIKYIEENGISVVVEPHLPKTYLDGAAIMIDGKNPVIGLTIRHDRLDNFWFTLLHELSHIVLHYDEGVHLFYDDLDTIDSTNPKEKEADDLAINTMIPLDKWKVSPASILPSPDAAKLLANQLGIHISIVAGRMRYERKQYQFLNELIGKGEVRKYFPEVKWEV